ncbi:hypothetical protein SASPL_106192 [Salvia splendens]|uniref:Mitochondrial intermembrane space import and assembly protein 40 homolog n=2 Tax=Salvia splendens TaxID=180675 RepID=A0A8X8YME8_SALSN|nr:hypothetical protein SASPL_106192 [Salvia splendens]
MAFPSKCHLSRFKSNLLNPISVLPIFFAYVSLLLNATSVYFDFSKYSTIFQVVMGQSQSAVTSEDSKTTASLPITENSAQPSLDSLIAEAAAYGGEDSSQSLEAQAQKALECPCIAHLRSGPCGDQFSSAFVCFLKSTAEEKGSDCVHPFVALQNCIKANPDAFSKDVLEDEEEVKKEDEPTPKYRVRPPLWSRKSKTPTQ